VIMWKSKNLNKYCSKTTYDKVVRSYRCTILEKLIKRARDRELHIKVYSGLTFASLHPLSC
jgi:hypothetical protein